jgi:hypothetical protein
MPTGPSFTLFRFWLMRRDVVISHALIAPLARFCLLLAKNHCTIDIIEHFIRKDSSRPDRRDKSTHSNGQGYFLNATVSRSGNTYPVTFLTPNATEPTRNRMSFIAVPRAPDRKNATSAAFRNATSSSSRAECATVMSKIP